MSGVEGKILIHNYTKLFIFYFNMKILLRIFYTIYTDIITIRLCDKGERKT